MRLGHAALALLLTACGAGGGASPEATLDALARALREGRGDAAYALMSEAYRQRVTREEFQARLEAEPREAEQTARALSESRGAAVQEAVVGYGESESLRLVRERGAWRVATDVVNFYDQSTPRATLRTFLRAMERRRYDVVLELIPGSYREDMTVERMRQVWENEGREEVDRLLTSLRAALENPIEEVGDRATMAYGERFTVHFVREDGLWRIEDPR